MKSELIILIIWYNETDTKRIRCFEENRRSFIEYNPGVEVITIMNPFENSNEAWLNSDLTVFLWYRDNCDKIQAERFLLLEWDCWCDINLKEYYSRVWDLDVVAPMTLYPERDGWHWFKTLDKMPVHARLYATGIVPFCGILVSEKAMNEICTEILKPIYNGLIGELRFPTIATMLGFAPVPNPVCSRNITWKLTIPFDQHYKGLHHPRKTLPSPTALDQIERFLITPDDDRIPLIIHQSWQDNTLPSHLDTLAETWKTLHPDWTYILWTDEMSRELIKRFFPEFLLQFDSYEDRGQRDNAARYHILYKIGGLFIDLDFECLENIAPLLEGADCVFGIESSEHSMLHNKEKIISNAFMAAKPNHEFFKYTCDSLSSYTWKDDTVIRNISSTTGSFALTDLYDTYEKKSGIKILPSSTIYPLTKKEVENTVGKEVGYDIQEKIDNAYALHYFLKQLQ